MAKTLALTPYLEFKYLMNAMIELGDGVHYAIPSRMVMRPNPQAMRRPGSMTNVTQNDPDQMLTMPDFDFGFVHKIALQDELPHIPKRLAGMSDAYHAKLCEQAYEKAAKAKIFNDSVREKVHHYVKQGVLEIVRDPFEGSEEIEGLAELAEAMKAAQAESATDETAPTVITQAEEEAPAPKAPKKK